MSFHIKPLVNAEDLTVFCVTIPGCEDYALVRVDYDSAAGIVSAAFNAGGAHLSIDKPAPCDIIEFMKELVTPEGLAKHYIDELAYVIARLENGGLSV